VAEGMAYLDGQLAALHDSLEPVMAAMNVRGRGRGWQGRAGWQGATGKGQRATAWLQRLPATGGASCVQCCQAALTLALAGPAPLAQKTGGRCLPEVRAAAAKAAGCEGAVLSTVKLLGRCLSLRQLIAEAASLALRAEFPVLSDAPEFAGSVTGAGVVYDPPRHACDVFELPRPGARAGGCPRAADPYVTKLLVGE
jgi:hypothetical protein